MSEDNTKLPFHRKYRPATLAEYIGNEKLKKTALAALKKEVKPQVILLEGASGCGKTTFARLLAKEYLCEDRNLETGACNKCHTCESLDDYIHTGDTGMLGNVHEIDIADQSGKRDIDSVLEEMAIPSYGDEWKVFIFDECHMATPQAQNRMLKIAEEPPENVLMIFCTTDPQMMLPTLKNRCQIKLKVKKPTVKDLSGLLKRVCSAEGVDSDIKGLMFIANRSDLTIRESLTNLEQVITEQGKARYVDAIKVFEEVSDTLIIQFFQKLLPTTTGKRDILGYVTLLFNIKKQTEFKTFVTSVKNFATRGIYIINQVQIDGVSDGELVVYRDLFSKFTVEQIANLLTRLSELHGQDLEMKLLLLGYTGLIERHEDTATSEKELLPNVNDSKIEKLDNEVGAEVAKAAKNRKEEDEKELKSGLEYAKEQTKVVSIDEVQDMFGGANVVKKSDLSDDDK